MARRLLVPSMVRAEGIRSMAARQQERRLAMMRGMDRWLRPYLKAPSYPADSVTRVFLAITDHFEPFHKAQDQAEAIRRMKRWQKEFPDSIQEFKDATGRLPRHTFFYPVEQYDTEVMSRLADLCAETGCQTEVHLHHEDDSSESLRERMKRGLDGLERHGLLHHSPDGKAAFCFIHGDWALANSHPEGHHCGVEHEIRLLRELGCMADFTYPSAPSPTQPQRVNSIYYTHCSGRPETLGEGPSAACGQVPDERSSSEHLLLIQGVVALNWKRRKLGLLPRLENSDITLANPPTAERWQIWLRHAPRVLGRPDWAFLKLHTHGATPWNSDMLLGSAMRRFREFLSTQKVIIHHVSAREMVELVHRLEDAPAERGVLE
jgi:hypothetical protein